MSVSESPVAGVSLGISFTGPVGVRVCLCVSMCVHETGGKGHHARRWWYPNGVVCRADTTLHLQYTNRPSVVANNSRVGEADRSGVQALSAVPSCVHTRRTRSVRVGAMHMGIPQPAPPLPLCNRVLQFLSPLSVGDWSCCVCFGMKNMKGNTLCW